ncbi:MAG: FHA domain-containing protein [Ilumatobacter sp.]|nr:FHA domain-containing protein [Ilumatobacter sp.]
MTDQVLNILKFALLGLLYLFFARVLWAVWSEVRMPRRRTAPAGPQRHPAATRQAQPMPPPTAAGRKPMKGRGGRVGRLVILEPRSRRGLTFPMAGEITLGRDDKCTISITDDTFVSHLHLRIYDHEGQPMLEDLGSTNGTFHNGNKLIGAKLLHPGDRIQVGTTVIEAQ